MISLDWTLAHHDRGPKIYGVKWGYDYVKRRYGRFQTVLTATVSNAKRVDGLEVEVQLAESLEAEKAYLMASAKHSYTSLEEARQRLLELLHHELHHKRYRKVTEMALAVVKQLEEGKHFSEADYAVDNGILHLDLCQFIEGCGKHWVSELECSRNILWQGRWHRIEEVAVELRRSHPEGFRRLRLAPTREMRKLVGCGVKAVRLKRSGTH